MIIIPKRRWDYPIAYERSYCKIMRAYAARIEEALKDSMDDMAAVLEKNGPKMDSYGSDMDALLAKIGARIDKKAAESALRRKVEQMYRGVNDFNEEEFKAVIRDAVGAEDFFINEKWQKVARSVWVQENIELIRSIRSQTLEKIRYKLGDMVTEAAEKQTLAAQLSEAIQDIAHNNRNRADLIARDQIGKLNGRLTQLRQQSAGITKYKWSTSKDERVRPAHEAREGKVYEWAHPPADGNPGYPIRCRCVAVPVIDTDTLGIPEKELSSSENGKIGVETLSDINDFNSLTTYLEKTYDIHMDAKVRDLDFESVKSGISGIESVIKEFPDLQNQLKSIEISKTGVMSCDGHTITFNPSYFSDRKFLEKTLRENAASGHYVKNVTAAALGAHEAGHAVEWLLLDTNPSNEYDFMKTLAWRDCAEAKTIVSAACKNIKKTSYGKKKRNVDLVLAISRYADTTSSEALAEAFADVCANGENANPLSIEIKRLTHDTFERYKKGGD